MKSAKRKQPWMSPTRTVPCPPSSINEHTQSLQSSTTEPQDTPSQSSNSAIVSKVPTVISFARFPEGHTHDRIFKNQPDSKSYHEESESHSDGSFSDKASAFIPSQAGSLQYESLPSSTCQTPDQRSTEMSDFFHEDESASEDSTDSNSDYSPARVPERRATVYDQIQAEVNRMVPSDGSVIENDIPEENQEPPNDSMNQRSHSGERNPALHHEMETDYQGNMVSETIVPESDISAQEQESTHHSNAENSGPNNQESNLIEDPYQGEIPAERNPEENQLIENYQDFLFGLELPSIPFLGLTAEDQKTLPSDIHTGAEDEKAWMSGLPLFEQLHNLETDEEKTSVFRFQISIDVDSVFRGGGDMKTAVCGLSCGALEVSLNHKRTFNIDSSRFSVRLGTGRIRPCIGNKRIKHLPLHQFPNYCVATLKVGHLDCRLLIYFMRSDNFYRKTNYILKREHAVIIGCLNLVRVYYRALLEPSEWGEEPYCEYASFNSAMSAVGHFHGMNINGSRMKACLPTDVSKTFLLLFDKAWHYLARCANNEDLHSINGVQIDTTQNAFRGYPSSDADLEGFNNAQFFQEAKLLYINRYYGLQACGIKREFASPEMIAEHFTQTFVAPSRALTEHPNDCAWFTANQWLEHQFERLQVYFNQSFGKVDRECNPDYDGLSVTDYAYSIIPMSNPFEDSGFFLLLNNKAFRQINPRIARAHCQASSQDIMNIMDFNDVLDLEEAVTDAEHNANDEYISDEQGATQTLQRLSSDMAALNLSQYPFLCSKNYTNIHTGKRPVIPSRKSIGEGLQDQTDLNTAEKVLKFFERNQNDLENPNDMLDLFKITLSFMAPQRLVGFQIYNPMGKAISHSEGMSGSLKSRMEQLPIHLQNILQSQDRMHPNWNTSFGFVKEHFNLLQEMFAESMLNLQAAKTTSTRVEWFQNDNADVDSHPHLNINFLFCYDLVPACASFMYFHDRSTKLLRELSHAIPLTRTTTSDMCPNYPLLTSQQKGTIYINLLQMLSMMQMVGFHDLNMLHKLYKDVPLGSEACLLDKWVVMSTQEEMEMFPHAKYRISEHFMTFEMMDENRQSSPIAKVFKYMKSGNYGTLEREYKLDCVPPFVKYRAKLSGKSFRNRYVHAFCIILAQNLMSLASAFGEGYSQNPNISEDHANQCFKALLNSEHSQRYGIFADCTPSQLAKCPDTIIEKVVGDLSAMLVYSYVGEWFQIKVGSRNSSVGQCFPALDHFPVTKAGFEQVANRVSPSVRDTFLVHPAQSITTSGKFFQNGIISECFCSKMLSCLWLQSNSWTTYLEESTTHNLENFYAVREDGDIQVQLTCTGTSSNVFICAPVPLILLLYQIHSHTRISRS